MAKVTGFTAERMLEIERSSIISAAIEGGDELVFYTKGGGRIRAGVIKGGTAEWIEEYKPIVDHSAEKVESFEAVFAELDVKLADAVTEGEAAKNKAQTALNEAFAAQGGVAGALTNIQTLDTRLTADLTAAQSAADTAGAEASEAKTKAQTALNEAFAAQGGVAGALTNIQTLDTRLTADLTTAQSAADAAGVAATKAKADALGAFNKAMAVEVVAGEAQASAEAAGVAAGTAKTTADSAVTTAATAQTTATQAKDDATTKSAAAESAAKAYALAQANAAEAAAKAAASSDATTKANAAKTAAIAAAALDAKTKADAAEAAAKAVAEAAQTRAEQADNNAGAAQSRADLAKDLADAAKLLADLADGKAVSAGSAAAASQAHAELAYWKARAEQGRVMLEDVAFSKGVNGLSAYGNGATGTLERVAAPAGAPTTSGFVARISTTVASSNRMVRMFYPTLSSRANAIFLQTFVAKGPAGTSLGVATNSIGNSPGAEGLGVTGGRWLGTREMDGTWQEFNKLIVCGSSGSFSTTGHTNAYLPSGAALPSEAEPFVVDVASNTIVDITDTPRAFPGELLDGIVLADTRAVAAQSAATAAASSAASAQSKADSAFTDAATAQSTATQAKADATSKANAAETAAKTYALAQANAAESAAKAAASTDATTKANAAEAAAKAAAALDATNKANAAKAAAEAKAATAQAKADQAFTNAATAKTAADSAMASALGAQSKADTADAKASTADGRFTIATANPTAANAIGKPLDAVWEVRSGSTVRRKYVLTAASTWTQVKAGQDFIGENAIGSAQISDLAVGTAQIADLAVTNGKIGTLAVDKLRVVGGATMPVAVINSLVSDQAFLDKVVSEGVLVTPGNLMADKSLSNLWTTNGTDTTKVVPDATSGRFGGPALTAAFTSATQNLFYYGSSATTMRPHLIPVTVGQEPIVVSFWACSVGGAGGSVKVGRQEWTDAYVRSATQLDPTHVVTTAWQQFSTVVTPTATAVWLGIYFGITAGAGTLHISDVRIERQTGSVLMQDGAVTAPKITASQALSAKVAEFLSVKTGQITWDNAAGNQAFIGSLVGDQAFVDKMVTDELLVTPGNLMTDKTLGNLWTTTGTGSTLVVPAQGVGYTGGPALSVAYTADTQYQFFYGSSISAMRKYRIPVYSDLRPLVVTFWARVAGTAAGGTIRVARQEWDSAETRTTSTVGKTHEVVSYWRRFTTVVELTSTARRAGISFAIGPGEGNLLVSDVRIERQVGDVLIENGAITAPKITASEELSAKVAEFIEVETGKITWDNAAGNNAFISSLIGDNAFFKFLYSNKVVVAPGNLLPDPQFAQREAWSFTAYTKPDGGMTGGGSLLLPASTTQQGVYTGTIPNRMVYNPQVVEGSKYLIGAWFKSDVASIYTTSVSIYYRWYNESGNQIGSSGRIYASPFSAGVWTHLSEVTSAAPAGATRLAIGPFTEASHNSAVRFSDPYVRSMTGAVLIEDGAIITPKISAKAITAEKIAVGALDAFQITSPLIQSVSTANRGIKWNGNRFVAYNTLGEEMILLEGNTGAINGVIITGGTVRTAASGQRIQLVSSGDLYAYSSGNVEVLRLQSSDTNGGSSYFYGPTNTGYRSYLRLGVGTIDGTTTPQAWLGFNGGDRSSSLWVHGNGGFNLGGTRGRVALDNSTGELYLTAGSAANLIGIYNIPTTTTTGQPITTILGGSLRSLYRNTSLRKYKLDVADLSADDPYRVLELQPRDWYDRTAMDQVADGMEAEYLRAQGEEVPERLALRETMPLPHRVPGFVAEEVVEVIPELASWDGDGNLSGVAYDRVAAYLLVAVKAMKTEIDQLRTQLRTQLETER